MVRASSQSDFAVEAGIREEFRGCFQRFKERRGTEGESGQAVCQDRPAGDGARLSKKKLGQIGSNEMKRGLVDKHGKLSIRKQCSLLGICRGGLYYKPIGESSENLEMMRLMDMHILK